MADALEGKVSSRQVRILRLHQLTPELAERVSRVGAVILWTLLLLKVEGAFPAKSASKKFTRKKQAHLFNPVFLTT